MRVVILGATGHIGTWLVPRLVRDGHEVMAVSRGTREPYHLADEWRVVARVTLDRVAAEERGEYGARIAALEPEVVIDLICFAAATARDLVQALRGRVRLFLSCGSLWVHGVPTAVPCDETARREPFGDYGIQKLAIERLLLAEAEHGFPAAVLHPGHISGPGWAPINPSGNLNLDVFAALACGRVLVLPGDGTARLQHVHADDVAGAFAAAVRHPERAIGEAFHIAAREPITMRDYAVAAAHWFGREAALAFAPWDEWRRGASDTDARTTEDHLRHSPCASVEKARVRLGFEPAYGAVDAARAAVAWLAEQRKLGAVPPLVA